ncbi:hypothetical protein NXH76_28740 [Blautia schinkii]|nr:hypothetical protein [Blautia schinkii]
MCERLKEKFHLNIINIMFWLSSTFIAICVIGYIIGIVITPHVSEKMKNNNYLFSDSADIELFETALEDNNIPYKVLSDTTISIPADWNDSAAEVYKEYFP